MKSIVEEILGMESENTRFLIEDIMEEIQEEVSISKLDSELFSFSHENGSITVSIQDNTVVDAWEYAI